MVPEGLAIDARDRDAPGEVEPRVGPEGVVKRSPHRVVEDVAGTDAAVAEEEQEPQEQERVGHPIPGLDRNG